MALRSLRLFSSDVTAAGVYYTGVCGLTHTHAGVYTSGMHLCDLFLSAGSGGAPRVASPLPTFAVSNLNTSKRVAVRRGGVVTEADGNAAAALGLPFPPSDFKWCVARDADGNTAALVHKFRRNCVVSLTLACASVPASTGEERK